MTTAAEYIASWEGFRSGAYWDVNHWRLGYGSDTEGPDQVNVTQGMTTTKERALQNLALRIPQYGHTIVRQIGADAWDKQTENGRTALLSLAYNYGSLPASVVRAIMTNDPENVAASIRVLQGANGGVNKKRRLGEAQFYLTGTSTVPKQPLPPVTQGGIVVGTGAAAGAGTAAANGANIQALIMLAISAISYGIALLGKLKQPAVIPPETVPAPVPVPLPPTLDERDEFIAAKSELKASLARYAAAHDAFRQRLDRDQADLADDPSVKMTIEHVPSPPAALPVQPTESTVQ